MNMRYDLVNNEGCLMDTAKTTSFAKARKQFSSAYSGKYKIIWSHLVGGEQSKNVNFK